MSENNISVCQYVRMSICQYVDMSKSQYFRMPIFSLGIKRKVVQNVKMMSENIMTCRYWICQYVNMSIFQNANIQLRYQNVQNVKTMSENIMLVCQHVDMSICQYVSMSIW